MHKVDVYCHLLLAVNLIYVTKHSKKKGHAGFCYLCQRSSKELCIADSK